MDPPLQDNEQSSQIIVEEPGGDHINASYPLSGPIDVRHVTCREPLFCNRWQTCIGHVAVIIKTLAGIIAESRYGQCNGLLQPVGSSDFEIIHITRYHDP